MAQARLPWRVLRPVFLAGAATVAWLTISTSAATADSSLESDSLLSGVTSSVSSLSAPLTHAVEPLQPAVSPGPASSGGLVQPVIGSVAGTADQLVAELPVVNSVVPADTVSSVATPVAAAVEETTAGLVDTLAPPLIEALPVLEPVLLPVAEVVGDSASQVVPLAELPHFDAISGQQHLDAGTGDLPATSTTGPAAGSPLAMIWPPAHLVTAESTGPDSPASPLPPAPAGPVSGLGSASSPSGPLTAAACLDNFGFTIPVAESSPIVSFLLHAPSPVSFDPGSSPD